MDVGTDTDEGTDVDPGPEETVTDVQPTPRVSMSKRRAESSIEPSCVERGRSPVSLLGCFPSWLPSSSWGWSSSSCTSSDRSPQRRRRRRPPGALVRPPARRPPGPPARSASSLPAAAGVGAPPALAAGGRRGGVPGDRGRAVPRGQAQKTPVIALVLDTSKSMDAEDVQPNRLRPRRTRRRRSCPSSRRASRSRSELCRQADPARRAHDGSCGGVGRARRSAPGQGHGHRRRAEQRAG